MFLYNIAMAVLTRLFRLVWKSRRLQALLGRLSDKVLRFVMAQEGLLEKIGSEMKTDGCEVWWLHAASLGEYNVLRPIVAQLRKPGRCIVVTFFSSTADGLLKSEENHPAEADRMFHLPLDTAANAAAFLDRVRPAKAVFAVSDYWPNYLLELRRRHIPTFFVSMHVADGSWLKRWYARPVRQSLQAVTTFAVLDEASRRNLATMGFTNAVVTGDPLFDNAARVAAEPWSNDVIARFSRGGNVFVAGSVSDANDLRLVSFLANTRRDVKFIIVPHEISAESLRDIVYHLEGRSVLYSECTPDTDFSSTQTLIIDFLGALARIYRYGRWAYVGGGFTPYLHSVVEPLAYGLPVAYGPRTNRKTTPKEMERLGIGCSVRTPQQLRDWFTGMDNASRLADVRRKALDYFRSRTESTARILKIIGA